MINTLKVTSPLFYAGSKRWVTELPLIKNELSNLKGKYFEPFFGGGSIFFSSNFEQSILSDLNPDLINFYKQLRNNYDEFAVLLKSYENVDSEQFYYLVRKAYNSDRHIQDVFNAVRFFYLNRTCFRGLYRVNSQGDFNVPYGFRKGSLNFDFENLKQCSLKLQGTYLYNASAEKVTCLVEQNDLVIFDPPYTGTFKDYTTDQTNQEQFKAIADQYSKQGARVIAFNSSCDYNLELWKDWNIQILICDRGMGDRNRKTEELIMVNF